MINEEGMISLHTMINDEGMISLHTMINDDGSRQFTVFCSRRNSSPCTWRAAGPVASSPASRCYSNVQDEMLASLWTRSVNS